MKKTMNPCAAPRNTLSKRCRMGKKISTIVATVLCCFVAFTMSAFAAEVDITNLLSKTEVVLTAIVCIVGAFFIFIGLFNLAEGFGNDNPGAKATGGKQLAAGIGIIVIALIMVPVLVDMMSDAASTTTTT